MWPFWGISFESKKKKKQISFPFGCCCIDCCTVVGRFVSLCFKKECCRNKHKYNVVTGPTSWCYLLQSPALYNDGLWLFIDHWRLCVHHQSIFRFHVLVSSSFFEKKKISNNRRRRTKKETDMQLYLYVHHMNNVFLKKVRYLFNQNKIQF